MKRSDLATLAGLVALGLLLILTSPGVRKSAPLAPAQAPCTTDWDCESKASAQ